MDIARASRHFPVPQRVVLVLLYVGVLRLAALYWTLMIRGAHQPYEALRAFLGEVGPGALTLPEMVTGINLLLVLHLWLGYRSPPPGDAGWRLSRLLAYVGASLLLLYLTYAFWHLSQVELVESLPRISSGAAP